MHIYDEEISIAHLIENRSIAYLSKAYPSKPNNLDSSSLDSSKRNSNRGSFSRDNFSRADIRDPDLYKVNSILVTTNMNKNDDIFSPTETWKARNSPDHKPTNINHDETNIVGHITYSHPITLDGSLIPDDTPINKLPDTFHLFSSSVIYKKYDNEEMKRQTEDLISDIEAGNKYVSMECMFSGFGYYLFDTRGNSQYLIDRDENTAFLTKHLRAYGGNGQYINYRVGRYLTDIVFSGKGFVDKPANPDSIIYN